jgi:ABC-type thiamine transport system substrate-binding protein
LLLYDLPGRMIRPWSVPMTENIKLPRKLSEERKPPPPRRPSHADVIETLDRWANSPGLQPPKSSEGRTA